MSVIISFTDEELQELYWFFSPPFKASEDSLVKKVEKKIEKAYREREKEPDEGFPNQYNG